MSTPNTKTIPKAGKKYVGAWVSREVYSKLKRDAEANHRSVSGELRHRFGLLVSRGPDGSPFLTEGV